VNETGIDRESGRVMVTIDPRYYRPTEVDLLLGDASKAHNVLGWTPGIQFDELVEMMVDADTLRLQN
jgi:GDPmannose 4,6-dehydratase